VHGFGFAGALQQLELSTPELVQALFGYNAGVELGQLAIVLAIAPGVLLVRVVARSMEPLQNTLTQCWTALRPFVHGVKAAPLRLWTT